MAFFGFRKFRARRPDRVMAHPGAFLDSFRRPRPLTRFGFLKLPWKPRSLGHPGDRFFHPYPMTIPTDQTCSRRRQSLKRSLYAADAAWERLVGRPETGGASRSTLTKDRAGVSHSLVVRLGLDLMLRITVTVQTRHRLDLGEDAVAPGPMLGWRDASIRRKACLKKSRSTCCRPILRCSSPICRRASVRSFARAAIPRARSSSNASSLVRGPGLPRNAAVPPWRHWSRQR